METGLMVLKALKQFNEKEEKKNKEKNMRQ
jgi:hypothetical protein